MFYNCDNFEDYVFEEMVANKGTDTFFDLPRLSNLYIDLFGEKPSYKLKKYDIVKAILEVKSPEDMYNEYKDRAFGLKRLDWMKKFGLTAHQMKKMVEQEFLLIPGFKREEKVFTGTYAEVQYYEAKNYFNYTVEEVEEWKMNNIRGYKKKKEREDGVQE